MLTVRNSYDELQYEFYIIIIHHSEFPHSFCYVSIMYYYHKRCYLTLHAK